METHDDDDERVVTVVNVDGDNPYTRRRSSGSYGGAFESEDEIEFSGVNATAGYQTLDRDHGRGSVGTI